MTAEIHSDEHEKDAASNLIAEAIGAAEDVLGPLEILVEKIRVRSRRCFRVRGVGASRWAAERSDSFAARPRRRFFSDHEC